MYYFDIIVSGADDEVEPYEIGARVFKIIHGINSHGGDPIALDINPNDGLMFRAFGERDRLEQIQAELRPKWVFRDYTNMSTVRRVPHESNISGYAEVRRRRVPNGKSVARAACLKYCSTLLHFKMNSASNGNGYIFSVDRILRDSPVGEFAPNNYGLSKPSSPFTIPVF